MKRWLGQTHGILIKAFKRSAILAYNLVRGTSKRQYSFVNRSSEFVATLSSTHGSKIFGSPRPPLAMHSRAVKQ